MKQLTAITMVGLLLFASCQKERELTNGKDISYTEADFLDNEVIDPSANKNPDRHSNMKVVIRQVNNTENTYRLVLKVDSVSADIDGDGVEEMLPLGDDATVQAGLSLPNPQNPDDALVVFGQTSLTFRKQNENGYYVFVSDAFTSDFNFEYELVQVSYLIGRWKFDDDASQDESYSKVAGSGQYFILPNGKSIEQDPDVTNFKAKGPGRAGAGSSAVFGSMRLTTFDDPIGQVKGVKLKVIVSGQADTGEKFRFPMEADFVPVGKSKALGVTIWTNERCMGNFDPSQDPPTWVCEDQLFLKPPPSSKPIYNFTLADILASILLVDENGRTLRSLDKGDLLAGSTDHF